MTSLESRDLADAFAGGEVGGQARRFVDGGGGRDAVVIRSASRRDVYLGYVTAPMSGRSRRLPMTQRLTSALKAARRLRSDRVLCLPDAAPITRDRVIKAIRGMSVRISG